MTDKEIFEKYCDEKEYTFAWMSLYPEYIKSTFSYKVFALKCAVSELKKTLAEIRLRIKEKLL